MSKIDEKTFAPVELVESGDHRGVRLSWDDISYSVTMKKKDEKGVADVVERKTLLHPMSGEALPGEILAIMGPSGAGKSTLLDVLSARLDSTHLKGTISANGTPVNKASFRKMSGYVMQSDALFPLLTVRETFRFAAYLRIAHRTREEKNARAEESIQLLRLEKAADTIIGDDVNRGLSGGEKRRVSIGVDIIHRPSVIFLDEPTSGLDSSTALSVVDSLKQLAETEHCTILMTIHQPSARLFDMLDKVTFLVDGKTAYKGSTEKLSIHIKDIYKEAGLGEVPMVNAPELFLDLCALLSSEGRLNLITDKFACTTSSTLEHSKSQLEEETHIVHASEYANTMAGDTSILMQRALLNVARTPELFVARLGATVFFGVLLGTLFLHTQDTMKGIQQRVSYFLFAMAFYYWTSLEALPIFLVCVVFHMSFFHSLTFFS